MPAVVYRIVVKLRGPVGLGLDSRRLFGCNV